MKKDIDSLIARYVYNAQTPFSLYELSQTLQLNSEETSYAGYLIGSNVAVFEMGDYYISRPGYFLNKPFSVLPTRFEISSKCLVVGHRCVPFANPDILSCDFTFYYKGKLVPKKVIELYTGDLFEYFSLFGEEFAPQYFCLDPANKDFDFVASNYELPGKMNATVLDMTAIFKENDFKTGDRLVLKMTSWQEGIFDLSVKKDLRSNIFESTPETVIRSLWFDNFEQKLLESFEHFGPRSSIDEQIAIAYVLADQLGVSEAAGSVEELIKRSKKIEAKDFGVETRLWFKDREIDAFAANLHSQNAEELPEVNKLFLTIGIPVSESLIDAVLYDSLYRQEKTCDAILPRLLQDNYEQIPKRESLFCLLHLEKRRVILSRDYNWFADHEYGKLRQKILDLYGKMLNFVYSLSTANASPEKLPQQPLVVLSQLFSHLGRMLESLSVMGAVSDDDIDGMYLSLEGMEYSFDDISEELGDAAKKLQRERFIVIKREEENHE